MVGGAVALVLLGVAGYFLWSKYSLESQVSDALSAQTTELDRLSKLDPHPGNEKVNNIEAAKQQDKKLQDFVAEARKTFVPMDYPTNIESGRLKLLLDTSIDELQRTAERAGVKLPPQYAFTFGTQKAQMSFEQNTIQPLTMMVMDIKTISLILFQSRILALDGIRRSAVTTTDSGSDFWNKKPTTNDWAVLTPYEFTFHCFTTELSSVIEGLYRSPHGFIVKNIVVDTAASQLLDKSAEGSAESSMPMGMPAMTMQQMQMMMRYGRGMRYGPVAPPPQETPSPTTTPRGGLTPMLDEKPFRAILWLEVVRLRDPNEVKAAKAARPAKPARPAPAAADGQPAETKPEATDGQTPAAPAEEPAK